MFPILFSLKIYLYNLTYVLAKKKKKSVHNSTTSKIPLVSPDFVKVHVYTHLKG